MVWRDEEESKYKDLEGHYKHYKITKERQIKRLTKDMYSTQYKKCNSFLFAFNLWK